MARPPYSKKYAERVIKALENLQAVEAECNKKYPQLIADECDEIAKEIIARWYAEYEPHYYNRQGGLYKAYKITVNGTRIIAEADETILEENANYNQGAATVYEIAFERGYHGGSYGKEGPQSVVPYWRTPFPSYTSWGKPAIKGFSIFDTLKEEMSARAQELVNERNEKLKKANARVITNMRAFVNRGR